MNVDRIYFLRGKIRQYILEKYPEEVSKHDRTYQEILADHDLDKLLECDKFLDSMLNRCVTDSWYEKTRLNEVEKILEVLTSM